MILDTLAIAGIGRLRSRTRRYCSGVRSAPQTQLPGVRATGTSRTGAPSVPISEASAAAHRTGRWGRCRSISAADIAVSTSVSAVPLGQNSPQHYDHEQWPIGANNVTLADTYNATNLHWCRTPSAGTSCTNTATTVNARFPPIRQWIGRNGNRRSLDDCAGILSEHRHHYRPAVHRIRTPATAPTSPSLSGECGLFRRADAGGALTQQQPTMGNGNVAVGAFPPAGPPTAGTIAAPEACPDHPDAGSSIIRRFTARKRKTARFASINHASNYR
jgi:hypothetical protein